MLVIVQDESPEFKSTTVGEVSFASVKLNSKEKLPIDDVGLTVARFAIVIGTSTVVAP